MSQKSLLDDSLTGNESEEANCLFNDNEVASFVIMRNMHPTKKNLVVMYSGLLSELSYESLSRSSHSLH